MAILFASPSGVLFAFAMACFGGKPKATSRASSSASLILRSSSLRFSASLMASALVSPLAYQFRSFPFCQRPTGAIRE
jgi:hypothetical protein